AGIARLHDLRQLAGDLVLARGGLVHAFVEAALGVEPHSPRAAMNLLDRSLLGKRCQIATDRLRRHSEIGGKRIDGHFAFAFDDIEHACATLLRLHPCSPFPDSRAARSSDLGPPELSMST